jgi:hypothetical protein
MNKRRLGGITAVLAGGVLLAACSTVSNGSDQVTLHYSAGSWSSTQ